MDLMDASGAVSRFGKKMIEESASFQKENGKIPTTILPLIERHDDLDINAYFVLRVWRYVYYHNDIEFGKRLLPNIQSALDWLINRDSEGFGLPKQGSFGGDWKDVDGVSNRTYSPYTAMVYLAALKKTIDFAKRTGSKIPVKKYEEAFKRGYATLNNSQKKGGMWTGHYYTQLWKDSRKCDKVLQDQTIGIQLGVVDEKKAKKIIKTLETHNTTPFGVAETFPYYNEGFHSKPGDYHNGGVWPHLSFIDAWGRLRVGEKESALKLIKSVCEADLSKDFTPNERLHSITGENRGMSLQGWNANYFGLVFFGLLDNQLDHLKPSSSGF